ncbi:XRE family transcriptional regulator [Sphingomonas oryzagri]
MTLGARIEERRQALGISQAELARRVPMSQSTMNSLINSDARTTKHLHKIARVLETTPDYLTGEIDDPDAGATPSPTPETVAEQLDAVRVPHLSLHYSMGGGNVVAEPTVLGYFTVPKEWLRGHIRGTPEDVAVIMGEGDSMEPTIRDGDMLLIDRAQRTMRQSDQIWAIAVRDSGSVKRLRRARSGGYEIHSDNPSVPVDFADDGEMVIVGRMIGVLNWK